MSQKQTIITLLKNLPENILNQATKNTWLAELDNLDQTKLEAFERLLNKTYQKLIIAHKTLNQNIIKLQNQKLIPTLHQNEKNHRFSDTAAADTLIDHL